MEDRFGVQYRITLIDSKPIEEYAREIAVEQTIEMPESAVTHSIVDKGIIGSIESITCIAEKTYDVTISYLTGITACTIPQFLNVLFGNISLKDNILVTDFTLNDSLRKVFTGPRFGIDGLRSLTGIYDRPLACTALKPMGSTVQELAHLAGRFANAGIDCIKDDHGLADQSMHPFKERVERCHEAVEKQNLRNDTHVLYFPSVCTSFDTIEEQVQFASSLGIKGILLSPLLIGIDTLRYLSQRYDMVFMAHPSFAGTFTSNKIHGMTPAFLLGKLFRLAGADISVFPNWGGRFQFTKEQCLELARMLRLPLDNFKQAVPCPAGGMNLERLDEMVGAFGANTMFLIGGGLIGAPEGIENACRHMIDKLRTYFGEKRIPPADSYVSSCALPISTANGAPLELLTYGYGQWSGRTREQYKTDRTIDFKGITRTELAGMHGEHTAFDLRYFEIEPGGYSSFEKHVHEHVIIGVCGKGELYKKGKTLTVNPHDIAYIAPMESHQIRNNDKIPFGFYCIVDHTRDRPQPVGEK